MPWSSAYRGLPLAVLVSSAGHRPLMDRPIITRLDIAWGGKQLLLCLIELYVGVATVRSARMSESHTADGLEGFGRSPAGIARDSHYTLCGRTNVVKIDSQLD